MRGSNFNDRFIGSNNPNNTDELFEGRGGDDSINGGGGFDTAVYGNEDAKIDVQLAAGDVFGGVNTGHDTLRSVEGVSGTNFNDTFNALGFTASSTNAGSAGVNGTGDAFNRFEGRDGDDSIVGNGNTQIAFDNAAGGVTVAFDLGCRPVIRREPRQVTWRMLATIRFPVSTVFAGQSSTTLSGRIPAMILSTDVAGTTPVHGGCRQ